MPIVDMQRRLRELGRIRLGKKDARGGPAKLDTFRLTSGQEELLMSAADLYGGTVSLWEDAPGHGKTWELTTEVDALPVAIPPGQSLSQWYEKWSGGGCARRCDGERDTISDGPCICIPPGSDPEAERDCKPTTRLNVMLPELWDIGVWRLETHGWYAAVELGGIVPLLEAATSKNIALKAGLRIDQRTIKRQGEPVRQFPVPVIEVGHSLGDLLQQAGMLSGGPSVALPEPQAPAPALGTGAPALGSGQGTPASPVATPAPQPAAPAAPLPPTEAERAPETPAPEPERAVPPPPQSTTKPVADKMEPHAKLAMRLREHGLSDVQRHALVSWFTNGEATGLTELDSDQVHTISGIVDQVDDGLIMLVQDGDIAWFEGAKPGATGEDGTYDADQWKAAMKAASGIGPTRLIQHARAEASKYGVEERAVNSIAALAKMPAEMQKEVMAWLATKTG